MGSERNEEIVFVGRQLAVLNCMQELRVCPAVGTEGLHCQRVTTALPQVVEQQSDQQSTAGVNVGAGGEDDVMRAGSVHSRGLITAPTAGT